jgi:hypothetical protein
VRMASTVSAGQRTEAQELLIGDREALARLL